MPSHPLEDVTLSGKPSPSGGQSHSKTASSSDRAASPGTASLPQPTAATPLEGIYAPTSTSEATPRPSSSLTAPADPTRASHSETGSRTKRQSRSQAKQSSGSQRRPRTQHAHSDMITEQYRLANEHFSKREDPPTWLEIVFYWFMSMLFAMGLSAAITAITTYASWYVLQGREPYASNFNIVYVGPLGAAILSIIPSTTMYVCDELLVRRFHVYWPDTGRIRLPIEGLVQPQQQSRKRKPMSADWITFWLTIAYVLAGAVFGPWLGWKLNPLGAIDDTMTAVAALKCGALGAGMVLSIPALWLSTMYGTRMYNGGKNLDDV
ncbi:hypothetical protein DAEQUDRAFT_770746 [Daedalea quercina L-15889]|uniref:Uncharacterized protein n=1 Tax=Daedalea quercina L-15889 TaxID=1314783 RepID=A0A165KLP5_9APHY|nr:hypothetical protein DAEQUDRAFT_770746 [Daedalea quercina L-15889]